METSIGGKEEDTLMVETGNGEKGKGPFLVKTVPLTLCTYINEYRKIK